MKTDDLSICRQIVPLLTVCVCVLTAVRRRTTEELYQSFIYLAICLANRSPMKSILFRLSC